MSRIFLILGVLASFVFADSYHTKIADTDLYVISVAKREPPTAKLIAYDDKSGELIKNTKTRANEHNVMLLKGANFTALIDTGFTDTIDVLRDKLNKIGVKFDDITHVIVTHAHFDHVGGVLGASGERNFKNAVMMIDKTEYDFWLNSDNERVKNALKSFEKVEFFEREKPLFDAKAKIWAISAYGHTPGHNMIGVEDGSNRLVFVADLLHVYDVQIADPMIAVAFDNDKNEAVKARLEVKDGKTLVIGTHVPFSKPILLP